MVRNEGETRILNGQWCDGMDHSGGLGRGMDLVVVDFLGVYQVGRCI